MQEARGGRKKQGGGGDGGSKYSPMALIKKAEELVAECNYELARRFYDKALKQDPNNTQALSGFADVLVQLGDPDSAYDALMRCIQLAPEADGTPYLQLAQLSEGLEALNHYTKGTDLLIKQRATIFAEEGETSERVLELNAQIASAFCAAAEIYLTDACFEENAEQECDRLVREALVYDPENPEVHQTMASLRISQSRNAEALECLLRGYRLWSDIEEDEAKPDYGFRTNTAKLFLELGQHQHARQILDVLTQEHDSIAEVWYLLHLAAKPTDPELATEAIVQAKELMEDELTDADDPETHDLLERINAAVASLPPPSQEEDGEEDGGDDDGDDDDEDDGEEGAAQDMAEGY